MPSREIRAVLEEESLALKNLVNLAKEKRDAILHDNIEELSRIIKAEEEELAVINGFESLNHDAYRELPELQLCYEERETLIEELKESNLLNQKLLEDSLAFINFSLRVLHGDEGGNLYGSSGNVENQGANSVINWRG